MSIKGELYTFLSTNAGISAVVGTRIYPQQAPTSADLPYMTIQRIASRRHHHMTAAANIASPIFQIDCYAKDSVTLESATEAVRNALDGFRGDMGAENVRVAFLDNERDDFDDPNNGTEIGIFRTSMDFEIWYKRTIPTG